MMNEVRSNIKDVGRRGKWLSCTTLSAQVVACLIFAVAVPSLVNAADFPVRAGVAEELIDAINTANRTAESDRIILEAGVYTLTEVNNDTDGPNGLPSITSSLSIITRGGTAIIERAATAPPFRILHVDSFPADLVLSNIVIRNGNAGRGGGLFNRGGSMFLLFTTVTGNSASQGGGISNSTGGLPGELMLFDSIVDNNAASRGGGGILNEGGVLDISNSTISSNRNDTFGGGGIFNVNIGTITIVDSVISDNTSGAGGSTGGAGIRNLKDSKLTIINSTISGNVNRTGNGRGGGINNAGRLYLNNVTITNNTTQIEGGGIHNVESVGTVTMQNTLIADNIDLGGDRAFSSQSPDCNGLLTSRGFNLIGNTGLAEGTTSPRPPACDIAAALGDQVGTEGGPISPQLEPLADNGGHTETHALLATSPAIDAGNPDEPGSGNIACERLDQRGFLRPADGDGDGTATCDIGAFELGAEPSPPAPMCDGQIPTIVGTPGDDVLIGTNVQDVIHGLGGNDTIIGLDGNDLICGGSGDDTVVGGSGNDTIRGGPGNDVVRGGSGDDELRGGSGDDELSGGPGNDTVVGGSGNDTIRGGPDDDALNGGAGTDVCLGGSQVTGDTAVNCETVVNIP